MQPHIVIDEMVVGAAEALEPHAKVTAVPGEAITRARLADADAVLIRTVTEVDAELVRGTPVRFVGTATAGTDHVDVQALTEQGVAFAHAPGCNALAVAQYVIAALLLAEQRTGELFERIGIIGLGNSGGRLVPLLQGLGRQVHGVDPNVDARSVGVDIVHSDAHSLISTCDAVTLHVPLTRTGPHPTADLVDSESLALGARLFINASRGGVLDDRALLSTPGVRAVLDVFQDEPAPPTELLDPAGPVVVATPHIAGYSRQAKDRATEMVIRPLAELFGWSLQTQGANRRIEPLRAATVEEAIATVCPLAPVEHELRRNPGAAQFRLARRRYPLREEFAAYRLEGVARPDLAAALGFAV